MQDRKELVRVFCGNRNLYEVLLPTVRLSAYPAARSLHMSCRLDEDDTHLITWYMRDRFNKKVALLSGAIDPQGEWVGFILSENREGIYVDSQIDGRNQEVLMGFIPLADGILEMCTNSRMKQEKTLSELLSGHGLS